MTTRYRPVYKYEQDWRHDGYLSPYADMTASYDNHSVLFGCQPNKNDATVLTGYAVGNIVFRDPDNLYNPYALNPKITPGQLFARNPFRIVADGTIVWEGVAFFRNRSGQGGDARVTFGLEGKLGSPLSQGGYEFINYRAEDTLTLGNEIGRRIGTEIQDVPNNVVGPVNFSGRGIDLFAAYAAFNAGFMLETSTGDWQFVDYVDQAFESPVSNFTLDYEPIDGLVEVRPQIQHVVNTAECLSRSPSSQSEQAVGSIIQTVVRSQRITIRIPIRNTVNHFIESASRVLAIRGGVDNPFISSIGNVRLVGNEILADVVVAAFTGQSTRSVRFDAYAVVSDTRAVTSRTIDSGPSVASFGRRDFQVPPWYDLTFRNAFDTTLAYITALGTPKTHASIGYSEWQPNESQFRRLRDTILPGIVNRFTVQVDGILHEFRHLVLAVRHSGSYNAEPVRTAYTMEIPASSEIPGAIVDLFASQSTAPTTTAEISVVTTRAIGKTLYVRYRRQFTQTYTGVDPITITNSLTELTLSGLTRTTVYELQASLSSDFSGLQEITFLTGIEPNVDLSEIKINGVRLAGDRNYDTTTSHTFTDRELVQTKTYEVTATAVDNNASVVVSPSGKHTATQPLQRLTFSITVSNGGNSRVYTLTIVFVSFAYRDITALDGAGNDHPRNIEYEDPIVRVYDYTDRRQYAYITRTGKRDEDMELQFAERVLSTNVGCRTIGDTTWFYTNRQVTVHKHGTDTYTTIQLQNFPHGTVSGFLKGSNDFRLLYNSGNRGIIARFNDTTGAKIGIDRVLELTPNGSTAVGDLIGFEYDFGFGNTGNYVTIRQAVGATQRIMTRFNTSTGVKGADILSLRSGNDNPSDFALVPADRSIGETGYRAWILDIPDLRAYYYRVT